VPDNKNHKSSLGHIDEKVTFNLAWKESHHNQNRFQLNSNQDDELLKQIIPDQSFNATEPDGQRSGVKSHSDQAPRRSRFNR